MQTASIHMRSPTCVQSGLSMHSKQKLNSQTVGNTNCFFIIRSEEPAGLLKPSLLIQPRLEMLQYSRSSLLDLLFGQERPWLPWSWEVERLMLTGYGIAMGIILLSPVPCRQNRDPPQESAENSNWRKGTPLFFFLFQPCDLCTFHSFLYLPSKQEVDMGKLWTVALRGFGYLNSTLYLHHSLRTFLQFLWWVIIFCETSDHGNVCRLTYAAFQIWEAWEQNENVNITWSSQY